MCWPWVRIVHMCALRANSICHCTDRDICVHGSSRVFGSSLFENACESMLRSAMVIFPCTGSKLHDVNIGAQYKPGSLCEKLLGFCTDEFNKARVPHTFTLSLRRD